jgi:hypothetical protein
VARWQRAIAFVIAAALAAGGCAGGSAQATGGSGPASTATAPLLPGIPGRFQGTDFAFDYPPDWSVIAYDESVDLGVDYVVAVVGNGTWHQSCATSGNEESCGADVFQVPPGGIVLKIYWRGGGPAPMCLGNTTANATVGPNAVQKTVNGTTTSWEVRVPGAEFGWPNNPIFEAHTSDSTQLARAQAVVASFHWLPGVMTYQPLCSPPPG